eukprot:TRINITY_DN17267_c0_g1_i1.p1 TRINITY_DN17267_c0_g1~~TRINITY_DN17267_c0_g1_i1.p1  ORF type:complete len:239 (+),score=52.50 TRINITY_DN17267_c0_g1_i1:6-722(+)
MEDLNASFAQTNFQDTGGDSDEEDLYIAGDDFDENEAILNAVHMGMDFEQTKQMLYNGFGHLLAQGYSSVEAYMDHMQAEQQRKVGFPVLETDDQTSGHSNENGNQQTGKEGKNRKSGKKNRGKGNKPSSPNMTSPRRGGAKKDPDHLNLANEDCRFYLSGICSKGMDCTYRHCEEAKLTSSVCDGWMRELKCEDPRKCKCLHPPQSLRVCHFYERGICRNETNCKFLHPPGLKQQQQ